MKHGTGADVSNGMGRSRSVEPLSLDGRARHSVRAVLWWGEATDEPPSRCYGVPRSAREDARPTRGPQRTERPAKLFSALPYRQESNFPLRLRGLFVISLTALL